LARWLDALGVDRIEVGMPVVSEEDAAAAEMIASAGLRAEPWGFCRCIEGDVDACLSAGLKHIVLEAPTSPFKLQAYDLSQEKVLSRVTNTVEYALSRGLYVAFFAVDATRSEEDFLAQTVKAAARAGASELVLSDTLSVATPSTMARLTRRMIEWTDLPVMAHCHNDFGLGTACTLAAVQAGAEYVQVTVNGLGEKAGNTDIAEVAFALKVLMGYEHDLDLKKLQEVAGACEHLSKTPLAPQKPVVGEKAFMRESGVVISQLNSYPPAVEAYDPSIVGRQTKVVLGKKSGRSSVEYMINRLGLPPLSLGQTDLLVSKIKSLSLEKKGPVDVSEFKELVEAVRRDDPA
jgi:isopropylmalate/homocitrate/citramalate synthase